VHQAQPVTPARVGLGDPLLEVPAGCGALQQTQPPRFRAQTGRCELAGVGTNRRVCGRERRKGRKRAKQQQYDECPSDRLAS
jgi:hypothetical protein